LEVRREAAGGVRVARVTREVDSRGDSLQLNTEADRFQLCLVELLGALANRRVRGLVEQVEAFESSFFEQRLGLFRVVFPGDGRVLERSHVREQFGGRLVALTV